MVKENISVQQLSCGMHSQLTFVNLNTFTGMRVFQFFLSKELVFLGEMGSRSNWWFEKILLQKSCFIPVLVVSGCPENAQSSYYSPTLPFLLFRVFFLIQRPLVSAF